MPAAGVRSDRGSVAEPVVDTRQVGIRAGTRSAGRTPVGAVLGGAVVVGPWLSHLPWPVGVCVLGVASVGAVAVALARSVLPQDSEDRLAWWRDSRDYRTAKRAARVALNRRRQRGRRSAA